MGKSKEGSFRTIGVFMVLTMLITFNWNKWAWLSSGIHKALDPSLGYLLNWNLTIGMLIIVFIISVVTTLVQKYTTNQKELRKIQKMQKELQVKQKEYKNDAKKSAEISKEIMGLMPKQMKLGMRTIIYTGIPFVLLFRWFTDYFAAIEEVTGAPVRLLGFLSWFWFYLIGTMLFSSILKKKFDVV